MKYNDHDDFERWLHEQTSSLKEPEVSPDFLIRQRRSIYNRLGERRHNWVAWRWAISLAMLLLLVAGFALQRRHPSAPAISDEQLFSDLSAMEQRNEPKAIQPIHNLFEE